MRLDENPLLPADTDRLSQRLSDVLRDHAQATNQVAEGKIDGAPNALTAAPTTGQYKQGDFVRNSAPAELGVATARYVVFGWLCVVSGTPGTFVQMRYLTGN